MRLGRSHQSPLQFLLFPLKPLLLFCPSPALLLHQTAQQCNTHRHTQRLTHSHAASACANVCTHAGHPHDSTTLRQTDCCIPSVPSSPPNGLRHPAFLTTQSRAHLITDCFPNSSIHQNLLLPTPPLPLPPLTPNPHPVPASLSLTSSILSSSSLFCTSSACLRCRSTSAFCCTRHNTRQAGRQAGREALGRDAQMRDFFTHRARLALRCSGAATEQ